VFITLLALGCSRHAGAVISKTTTTNNIPQVTTTPMVTTTAGILADAGAGVYRVYCSGCHGIHGRNGLGGVTLIGPGSALSLYGTVNGLLSFISRRMPYENPGSLTAVQYNQITAYLSVQNTFISPTTTWENLSGIILQ